LALGRPLQAVGHALVIIVLQDRQLLADVIRGVRHADLGHLYMYIYIHVEYIIYNMYTRYIKRRDELADPA
jgi:hypothetical protein